VLAPQLAKQSSTWTGRRVVFALFVVLVCLCISGVVPAVEESHLLDGKSYVGKNGEKGQKLAEYEDEEIVFRDGKFLSVSCEPYHFGSSPYAAKVIGDEILFDAVTESPTHGKITWHGTIKGDQAEVSFIWTKERWYWDIHREYWFRGTLKK